VGRDIDRAVERRARRRGAEGGARHFAVDAVEDRSGLEQYAAKNQPALAAEQQHRHDREREQGIGDRDVERASVRQMEQEPTDPL